MTALAPPLSRFLSEHLPRDQRVRPHSCDAYAYSFQLLVTFAATSKDAIAAGSRGYRCNDDLAFLEHIERERGNTSRSRNARLAAIKSFFRFLEYRVPACLDQSLRVRAIPMKKTDEALVASLTRAEIQALIDRARSQEPFPAPEIVQCSTSHFPQACASPSWSNYVSTSSICKAPVPYTSLVKVGGNVCFHCGRKAWSHSGLSLPCDNSGKTERYFSTPPALP
ncbi:site-specific integrase [Rhizobium sp. CB3060]|uniref:site-specific integrase n=1 Tax=Rhizobium sp. CB3060 TaxID=3138255 RepID=UPI0040538CF5